MAALRRSGVDKPYLDVRPALDVAPHSVSSRRTPTLWNVPTRRVPASPSASARRSASAARIAAEARRACRRSRCRRRSASPARLPPGARAAADRPPAQRRDLLADRRLGVAELLHLRGRTSPLSTTASSAARWRISTPINRPRFVIVSSIFSHFTNRSAVTMLESVQRFDLELRVLLALAFVNGIAESSFVPLLPSVRAALGLDLGRDGPPVDDDDARDARLGDADRVRGQPLRHARAAAPRGGRDAGWRSSAQAVAGGLELLLAARLLFGLSFGILWVIGPARAAANGRGAGGTGPLIAASGVGWLVGPIVAGLIADAGGWRVASGVLAVATLPLIPLVARYAAPRRPAKRLESLRLRASLRPRPSQPRDRRRGARERPTRRRRRRLGPAPAARARGQRAVRRRDRARVRALGRRLDRRCRGRRPDARVGACTCVAWALPSPSSPGMAAAGFQALDACARRLPPRLDRCRSTINALNYAVGVRASEGTLGADGDRRR